MEKSFIKTLFGLIARHNWSCFFKLDYSISEILSITYLKSSAELIVWHISGTHGILNAHFRFFPFELLEDIFF